MQGSTAVAMPAASEIAQSGRRQDAGYTEENVQLQHGCAPRRYILKTAGGKQQLISTPARTVAELKAALRDTTGIPIEEQLLSSTAGMLSCETALLALPEFAMLHVRLRCLGGKGGFGAMLRGQASRPGMKKVESNTGAMRDLSGRRLRHVEQESKLEEWAREESKRKAEREAEKQQKKQKVYQRTHEAAEQYVAEATIDVEAVSSAVLEGISEAKKKAAETAREEEKKKQDAVIKAKKLSSMWGDGGDGSDDSADPEDDGPAAKPAAPKPAAAVTAPEAPAASTNGGAPSNGAPAATKAVQDGSAPSAAAPVQAAAPANEGAEAKEEEDINVEEVAELAALEAMGGERLKQALKRRGLKCGGTPQQRAERLWSVRGLERDKWPAAALQPPAKDGKK